MAQSTPQLKDVRQIADGWLKKYELDYALPDGRLFTYESVSRKGLEAYRRELQNAQEKRPPKPDAVCIVPTLRDGRLLMIREFRYPLNSWCISLPAGLLEPGETLRECVERELKEETGYRLRSDLGERAVYSFPQPGYSSTGMSEENVLVAFAQVEPDGDATPEPNELIETFTLHPREMQRFLEQNTAPIGTRAQLILHTLYHLEGGEGTGEETGFLQNPCPL